MRIMITALVCAMAGVALLEVVLIAFAIRSHRRGHGTSA